MPDTKQKTASAKNPPPKARWPLIGLLAWFATVMAVAQITLAIQWHDDLGDASPARLVGHFVALMAQTFMYHAGLGLLIVTGFAIVARRRRLIIASVIPATIALIPAAMSLTRFGHEPVSGTPSVRILSANLLYGHASPLELLKLIADNDPDVIVFQEWTNDGAAGIRSALSAKYPNSFEQARDDAFGQAVFSRRSFVGVPRSYPPSDGWSVPQINVAVDIDGQTLRVCNVHVLPPVSLAYLDEQRRMIKRLIAWGSDQSREDRPDVFVGDFNAASSSSVLSGFQRAGFVEAHATAGFWRGSTWTRTSLLRFAPGVRIDNAFVGGRWRVNSARVLSDVGSDHSPILIHASMRKD